MSNTLWNVIYIHRGSNQEFPQLFRRTRQEAMECIEQYFSFYTRVSLFQWDWIEGDEVIASVKLEKAQ